MPVSVGQALMRPLLVALATLGMLVPTAVMPCCGCCSSSVDQPVAAQPEAASTCCSTQQALAAKLLHDPLANLVAPGSLAAAFPIAAAIFYQRWLSQPHHRQALKSLLHVICTGQFLPRLARSYSLHQHSHASMATYRHPRAAISDSTPGSAFG